MKTRQLVTGLLVAAFLGLTQSAVWASYTDKSLHDPGDHEYKHPNQRSFTGPFDYAPQAVAKAIPVREPQVQAGKCNQFTFDATKSYDVDKQKLSIMWDFGDGTTSDQPVVKHVYEKAGDYNVTLTVKDSSGMTCDTGAASTKVSANFPPTAVAGENKQACLGDAITFDGSASTSSGAAKYTWDFGDGETAEGAKVTHAYQKAGNYRVVLTVDDQKNTECSVASTAISASVHDRAEVSLKGTEATCTGRAASFDATATGGNLKYHWDFGDGSTWDGGARASHAYQKGGNYTVTVTVDNGQNMPCSVATGRTNVKVNGTPIADAGENVACCVGKSTAFDGTKSSDPDGDALTYRWDFGDGGTSDEAKTTHVYEKSGTYRVVLTVTDSSGSDCGSSSSSFVANVNTSPNAVIEVR